MGGFILLDDAAKTIDDANGRTEVLPGGVSWFSTNLNRQVFSNTHETLLLAALNCQLPTYDPISGGRILPTESDKRIWTTVVALNDWLKSNGKSYRFHHGKAGEAQQITLNVIDWNHWLSREQIDLDECLLLAMGENPNDPDNGSSLWEMLRGDKYRELRDKAEQWIDSHELNARRIDNNGSLEIKNIAPLEFFCLARLHNWFLPEPIHDWLGHQDVPKSKSKDEVLPGVSLADFKAAADLVNNEFNNGKDKIIDWAHWASRLAIMPEQAARLAHNINPIVWPDRVYKQGLIPKDILDEITALTEWLKERNSTWRLSELVLALGGTNAPIGMVRAVQDFTEQNMASKPQINGHGCYTLEQAARVDDTRRVTESGNQRSERELKQGLREIWVKEGRPEMKAFFPDKLKKYINQSGSPITEVYTAGKDAGFTFKLSTGTTGNRTKKTLSNYVSEFKKTP